MKLWLDDVREMPKDYDFHVETVEDAIMVLEEFETTHVGFDHDLGENEKTGYDLACWIEEQATHGLPRLTWSIQSDNPAGANRIEAAMKSATRYWRAVESMCKNNELFPILLKHFGSVPEALNWMTHRDPKLGHKTAAQMLLDAEYRRLTRFVFDNFVEDPKLWEKV